MTTITRKNFVISRLSLFIVIVTLLGACAHPIVIRPPDVPVRSGESLSSKKVAYVMTDVDRKKQVTTAGGGGDEVTYYPYQDLEKAIRDALHFVYADVFVIKSPNDSEAIHRNDVSFVFDPEITTMSSSSSIFTWPPTYFEIDLSCSVADPVGNVVSRIRVYGNGTAEFSEFKGEFGLAGQRAASDLSEKLKQEILSNPRLY